MWAQSRKGAAPARVPRMRATRFPTVPPTNRSASSKLTSAPRWWSSSARSIRTTVTKWSRIRSRWITGLLRSPDRVALRIHYALGGCQEKGASGRQGRDSVLEPRGDDLIEIGPGRDRRLCEEFLHRHRRAEDDRQGMGAGIRFMPGPDLERAEDPGREKRKIHLLGQDTSPFLEGLDGAVNAAGALREDAEDLPLAQDLRRSAERLEEVRLGIHVDDPIGPAEHGGDRMLEELLKAQKVEMTDDPEGEGGPDGEGIDIAGMIRGDEIGAAIRHVGQAVNAKTTEEPEEEAQEAMGKKGDDERPACLACRDLGLDRFGGLADQDLAPGGAKGFPPRLHALRPFSEMLLDLARHSPDREELRADFRRQIDPEQILQRHHQLDPG